MRRSCKRGPSRGVSYHPFTCHVNVNITTKTKRRFPPFPRLVSHQSIVHGLGWVLRSGADIDIFQRYPTHGQFHTLCAFVMSFVFDTCCHADAHTQSFHPFQGTFSLPPSNVPIKSSMSERWEMVASGSVAWTASPNKSIASSTPSVCLYFTLSMRPEWLATCMLTPLVILSHRCQRRVVVRARLVAACSRLRGMGI